MQSMRLVWFASMAAYVVWQSTYGAFFETVSGGVACVEFVYSSSLAGFAR